MNKYEDYLFSLRNTGIKLGLERTFALMEACGNPHLKLPSIQIAGTNGKGSTAAMISSILQSANYKTGLFTSPHLLKMNERIRINDICITNSTIEEFIETFRSDIESISASFFEILTAMAFWYFHREGVEIAVLETGLGGRLDSVTVCNPLLVVMTAISKDHTHLLGNTIEKIAVEKAGIFKNGIPCVSCRQLPEVEKVLLSIAERVGSKIIWVETPQPQNYYPVGLSGNHQQLNAAIATKTIKSLSKFNVDQNQINEGLKNVKWFGRFQIIRKKPLVIFDVGHNKDGILAFLDEFENHQISGRKVLIIAMQSTKDLSGISKKVQESFDEVVCTQTPHYGFMEATVLASKFSDECNVKIIPDPHQAIHNTMKIMRKKDALAIIGTHYLGEAINSYYKISFDNT